MEAVTRHTAKDFGRCAAMKISRSRCRMKANDKSDQVLFCCRHIAPGIWRQLDVDGRVVLPLRDRPNLRTSEEFPVISFHVPRAVHPVAFETSTATLTYSTRTPKSLTIRINSKRQARPVRHQQKMPMHEELSIVSVHRPSRQTPRSSDATYPHVRDNSFERLTAFNSAGSNNTQGK